MNNFEKGLKNYFSQIAKRLIMVFVLLGFGAAGAWAQDLPDPRPVDYYFKIGDEITNEITVAPGENFTLILGATTDGPFIGGTFTILWDPSLLNVPQSSATDIIGSDVPIPVGTQVINNTTGYATWTKGILGSYLSPDTVDGVPVPTSYDMWSYTFFVDDDAPNTTTTIEHKKTGADASLSAFNGVPTTDPDQFPEFTVNIVGDVDCPDLGLNYGDACDDGNDLTENDIVGDDCVCAGTPIYDCPDLEANYGDACDDGNDLTENDIVGDDCVCAGTPIYDCPDLEANYGDACDDGNDLTENDIVGDDCVCAGTPIYDCPDLEANYGDACDDGNDLTENDIVGDDCVCAGTPIYDCPDLLANYGDACDDGNDLTENDIVGDDCVCAGTPIYDCPDLEANYGDACDDGNDLTENDMVGDDCVCAGTPIVVEYDCPDLQANYGDACDDENPDTENDMVGDDCVCAGTPIVVEYDCPDLQANYGDDCDDGDPNTVNDMVSENCECVGIPVTTECNDFVYYLSDHAAADGISSIYKVTLSGGNANLDLIAVSDIEVHIAYNPMNNLIYAVSKHENSYRTLDPETGVFGFTEDLGADYGEITAAVFNADGKLLIGSQDHNMIYTVNVATNAVSVYDTYSPLYGGDLAFASDGMLYLATRTGSGLYENWPAGVMPDQLIGTVPDNVTGMAITDADQLLISSRDHTSLEVRNTDGSNPGISYPVMLDGVAYTLRDGDMASGCNTREPIPGDCADFTTFYVNHGDEIDGSNLYTVEFTVGGLAIMTYVTNVAFEAHISFNAQSNIMYFVNADGSSLSAYDVTGDAFIGDLPFSGSAAADLSKITAVIYNPDDGYLYIGDDITDKIYTVDLGTGEVTFFANGPVSGGDMAILEDGNIYLATRTGNKLYQIVEGGAPILIGDIAPYVTGMARWNDASTSLVLSNNGSTNFTHISSADASVIDTYTATLDGSIFSLSNGDMAAGCADEDDDTPELVEAEATLTSFPNPTSGNSEVVFTTPITGKTLIEVYDMNGRNVATIFNQEAQAKQEYRLDFDGHNLPNGVYIYRMTTNNETIIEKFMIAK